MATSYRNLIQTEIKNWSKPINRGSGEFTSPDYYFYYTSEILLETIGIICMRFDLQEYTGGAHPNYTTKYIIFDKTKKKELKISDLVIKKSISNFWKIAETFFGNEAPSQLLFEPKFIHPENIGINSNGIVLFYNRYEIAPYSSGDIQFIIPFEFIYPTLNEVTRRKLFK